MALTVILDAWAGNPRNEIKKAISAFRHEPDVEVVHLGSFAMSMLRGAARLAPLDAEDRVALNILRGIKQMTIVDFEDASEETKGKFSRKILKIMEKETLLMEAVDEGERVSIWGVSSPDGKNLRDFVLLEGTSTLISIVGTINMDQIGDLLNLGDKL